MITYNEKNRTIKLDTPNTSYVLGIEKGGFLLNLYYGRRLPDDNLWALTRRLASASFSPCDPEYTDFSTDVAPMEYPTNGRGDLRVSALSVRNSDGNSVTDLRYVSHRIFAGKPDMPGLPHLYVTDDSQCETLEVTMCDAYTNVEAVLVYTVFADCDAISKHVRLTNKGDKTVKLECALSRSVDLPSMDYDLITLWGRHAKERQLERRPLAHGLQGIHSKRGSSSHSHNPFAALIENGATETNGNVYGFNLIYSGNYVITAEVDHDATTRIVTGINPEDFGWQLNPGESFITPETVHVFSAEGLGGMSRTFHRLYDTHLIRGRWQKEKRPLLINSWEAAYFDFDTDKLISFAERAKELGIEMLVMDDGWFGKRYDDTTSLGDWKPNPERLPDGVKGLKEKINAIGLELGIWFEPEMVSPDSNLYRAHPDWALQIPGREPALARTQYVLDITREEVREYIYESVASILRESDIRYVKWDMNRPLTDIGSRVTRPGEIYHRYILGLYELMDRLTTEFPDLLLENCSSGGGRFDMGMLCYSPQIWCSDNTDAVARLDIQEGTTLVYPPSAMGAHVSVCPNHLVGRTTDLRTRGYVALAGTFGYELDITKVSDEDMEIVREQVSDYKRFGHLVREGDYYRLASAGSVLCSAGNPVKGGRIGRSYAWSFVSKDKSEVLLTYIQKTGEANVRPEIIKLAGIDRSKRYRLDDGRSYTGDELMNIGFVTDRQRGDGSGSIYHFTAEEV